MFSVGAEPGLCEDSCELRSQGEHDHQEVHQRLDLHHHQQGRAVTSFATFFFFMRGGGKLQCLPPPSSRWPCAHFGPHPCTHTEKPFKFKVTPLNLDILISDKIFNNLEDAEVQTFFCRAKFDKMREAERKMLSTISIIFTNWSIHLIIGCMHTQHC